MREPSERNDAALRRNIYMILLVIAGAMIAGRIAVVRSSTGEVPFLSANDRSRWCTISSLVDDQTYAIDRQISYREPVRKRRVWYTIDMVRHRGPDGKQHYYSSKPPLYPTMLAGVYAVFKAVTGASVMDEPFMVGRWMIAIVNLLPMLGYFALMLVLIERFGKSNYGRILAAAAVTCGTLLVPYSISINNHVPGAICSAIALYCVLTMRPDQPSTWLCFVAGLAGGFGAANELPALSMTCLWAALILWSAGIRSAAIYCVGVLVIAIGFFGTNLYAHGSWRPPYMHRGVGSTIGQIDREGDQPDLQRVRELLMSKDSELDVKVEVDTVLEIRQTTKPDLLEVWNPRSQMRYALQPDGNRWLLSHWDDWYDYEGTYWQPGGRSGVDTGEASRWRYAMNATIGHHGIFSLTPIWLLSIVGMFYWVRNESTRLRNVSLAIAIATCVCFAFYIARPLIDRNYGGVSCSFRWMLWFIPLWIWLLLPAADLLARHRLGRMIGIALLAISLFSVFASLENPWQHPWIYRYWDYLGWLAG